jgi:hypothetical protein
MLDCPITPTQRWLMRANITRMARWAVGLVLPAMMVWMCRSDSLVGRIAGRPYPSGEEEVIQSARDLNLACWSDAPHGLGGGKIILSARPLTPDFLQTLILNDYYFSRWAGTVAVWRQGSFDAEPLYGLNVDFDHPDHYAQWGDLFVYGDPELMRALLTAWRQRREGTRT